MRESRCGENRRRATSDGWKGKVTNLWHEDPLQEGVFPSTQRAHHGDGSMGAIKHADNMQ